MHPSYHELTLHIQDSAVQCRPITALISALSPQVQHDFYCRNMFLYWILLLRSYLTCGNVTPLSSALTPWELVTSKSAVEYFLLFGRYRKKKVLARFLSTLVPR